MNYEPELADIRINLFSRQESIAVDMAAAFFDAVECDLRQKVGSIRSNADFALVAGVICFLFFLKIVNPMLPMPYQNKAALIAYIVFFISAMIYPLAFYKLPSIVDVSYLFRKEKFLHDFIDHYKLGVDKPVLVDKQITASLLFVKMPVSKKTIAAVTMVFLKIFTVDPLEQVIKNG